MHWPQIQVFEYVKKLLNNQREGIFARNYFT